MAILEKFNFDVIIAIVVAGFIAFALYFRFKRQLAFTLSFLLPFIITYFLYDFIAGLSEKTGVQAFIAKVLPFAGEKKYPAALTVAVLTYLLFFIIIRLFMLLLREPIEEQIVNRNKSYLKAINVVMGLLNAYATVMLLMFALTPVAAIDASQPVTATVMKTSNPVFAVSFLNDMKNKEQEYADYRAALERLSGAKAAAAFEELTERLDGVAAENARFANDVYPGLNDASRELLSAHLDGGDYVAALLTATDQGLVLDRIIALEAESEVLSKLQEVRTKRDGHWDLYVLLRKEGADFEDFFAVATAVTANTEHLAASFRTIKDRTGFFNRADELEFFLDNYQNYQAALTDTPAGFDEYIESFSRLYADYDDLCAYAERLLRNFSAADTVNASIARALRRLLKCRDKAKLYSDVPVAFNIVFAGDSGRWYVRNRWEKHYLFRSYLIDAITDPDATGYGLYHRYFFYRYLSPDAIISADDLLEGLTAQVSAGLLSKQQAMTYLKHLLTTADSVLRDPDIRNRLTAAFYEDLRDSGHELISAEIQQHLEQ